MAAYYRRFIKNFAQITKALTELMKKESKVKLEWTPEAEEAVKLLKKRMVEAPILTFPDYTKKFYLEIDASKQGLGAVLSQEGIDGFRHPISFNSKSLNSAESRYCATELEGLALIWAIQKFHPYIYGADIEVLTDHNPLRALQNKSKLSDKLHRWAVILS